MRCLVTGVAGFVGSHLAESLLHAGYDVVGIDGFNPYYGAEIKRANIAAITQHAHFRLVEGDLCESDLASLVADVDRVFHLAGQPGVRGSWGVQFAEYERHNVLATQRLLEALRDKPHVRFVYASSSSVYGDVPLPMSEDARPQPLSPYGVTKLAAEHLVQVYWRSYGLSANMLRFFTVYGPRQRPDMAFNRFITAIGRGEPLTLYGDGNQTRDFTYVDDVVDACMRAAECKASGEIVNIGGGSHVSVSDVLTHLGEITGKSVRVEHLPGQRGDAPHTAASIYRARGILGWQPKVSLVEGLQRQSEWQLGQVRGRARSFGSVPQVAQATPRLLIYGHDTYGLGHLCRNLTLATRLTRDFPTLSILLLTGSPAVRHFALPENVDYIKLPAVVKVADEEYHARSLRLQPSEIVQMRTDLVQQAVRGFAPDVILVDHAPIGMKGELLPALDELRRVSPHAYAVLGLRDIIDEPERVRESWARSNMQTLLERYYDAILTYGMKNVLDVAAAYGFSPQLAAKLRYCGYLERSVASTTSEAVRSQYGCAPGQRMVLATTGGGGDGYPLLHTYLSSLREGLHADGADGADGAEARQHLLPVSILVTGPFMPESEREELHRLAEGLPQVHLLEFVDNLIELMGASDLVVCMGGYNTLCEVLSVGAHTLVVPRVEPRVEQLLRAQAFERLGLVSMLHPDALTPRTLWERMEELLGDTAGDVGHARQPYVEAHAAFVASGALNGLETASQAIGGFLSASLLRAAHAS